MLAVGNYQLPSFTALGKVKLNKEEFLYGPVTTCKQLKISQSPFFRGKWHFGTFPRYINNRYLSCLVLIEIRLCLEKNLVNYPYLKDQNNLDLSARLIARFPSISLFVCLFMCIYTIYQIYRVYDNVRNLMLLKVKQFACLFLFSGVCSEGQVRKLSSGNKQILALDVKLNFVQVLCN